MGGAPGFPSSIRKCRLGSTRDNPARGEFKPRQPQHPDPATRGCQRQGRQGREASPPLRPPPNLHRRAVKCSADGDSHQALDLASRPSPAWNKGDPLTYSPSIPAERHLHAVLLLRRGHSLEEIARALRNHGDGSTGVSASSAEVVLRSGLRAVLAAVQRGERPPWLSPKLWPPESVRRSIINEPRAPSDRARLRILRQWIEAAAGCDPRPTLVGVTQS